MNEFIRLPNCVINLAHIRMIEFEGDVVLVHWASRDNHLVLRGDDATALLDGLERRYRVMSDVAGLYSDHCDGSHNLDNIFTSASR